MVEKRGDYHAYSAENVEVTTFFGYTLLMNRNISNKLAQWKAKKSRKPLIINGARQVGKTYALQSFAKSYASSVYINFEEMTDVAKIFLQDLDPERIIKLLALYSQQKIIPESTLIIFDEIQACPRALTSLKYFCEKLSQYQIVSAGSLLGVKLKREGISFPVGKVEFVDMFPMTFFEFLDALGHEQLKEYLESDLQSVAEPFHQRALDLLRTYFCVGGMPEAVATYTRENDLNDVRQIQMNILRSYELDFAKYATPTEVMKISKVWNILPAQLSKENKKFTFSAISKSARGREYMSALQWLHDAGLVYFSNQIDVPKKPLSSYTNSNAFKVYCLDVGLLAAKSHLDLKSILNGDELFTEFKGALSENYAASVLTSTDDRDALYYWTSGSGAEVDYVMQINNNLYPLEVKAGTSRRKKSLLRYKELYSPEIIIRASLRNLEKNGGLLNIPMYLLGQLKSYLTF